MFSFKTSDRTIHNSLAIIVLSLTAANATTATPPCGATTASKYIQLRQPPNPPRECKYYINAYNNNICQLRIDFSMSLAQPTIPDDHNGLWYVQCVRDYFAVNGLKFCGSEEAQHIYVPYNRTAGIELKIVVAARKGPNAGLPAPQWNMMITQLECLEHGKQEQILSSLDKAMKLPNSVFRSAYSPRPRDSSVNTKEDMLLAPAGCLQYFPETTGTIVSFNYAGGAGVYNGNLNYAICFRRTHAKQQLKLKMHYFNLDSEYSRQKFHELDNYCRPQLHSEGLSEDYLLVPQAFIEESNIRATYFCGNSIQGDTVISTNPGPLMLIFNSDGNYKAEREVGFAFSYSVDGVKQL